MADNTGMHNFLYSEHERVSKNAAGWSDDILPFSGISPWSAINQTDI